MLEVETTGKLFLMTGQNRSAVAPRANVETARADVPLVEAAMGGDREAFGQLYHFYAAMVHGILLARVPYAEVSDLVQDVFLIAFKKVGTLRDSRAFGPWLAMIARNRAMDFYRHSRQMDALPEELPEELARSAPPRAEAMEALEAIRNLPDAYRETLVLRFVEGMTGPEIAAQTGLQPDSVRVNLHRGMKLLREKLGLGGDV